MVTTPCRHQRTGYFRHMHTAGFHVAEHCLDCGANVTHPGPWARQDAVNRPELLPVWNGVGGPAPDAPLFDGWSEDA